MPYILSNGIKMYYEEQGSGDPLLLIMGLGAPGNRWEDHVSSYQEHFRCFLIDNRGAGKSDKPKGPYSTKLMADDIAGLMETLDIRNSRVAGISMGSAVAQELAINYPKRVRSMVLISSWSRCDKYTRALFEQFKKMRANSSPADFTQLLQLWITSAEYYEEHFSEMIQDQKKAKEEYMPLHAFKAQCDACISHNTYNRLNEIKIPVLLTAGGSDITIPTRLTKEMHEKLSFSKLVVFEDKGHIHHWEELEMFNNQTISFLKEN